MRIANALLQEASYAARRADENLREIEAQRADIERQKLEIEAQREQARLAPQRLREYRFKIGTEYQCPRCWIDHERRSALRGISSATDDDLMRCSVCPAEFVIPSG